MVTNGKKNDRAKKPRVVRARKSQNQEETPSNPEDAVISPSEALLSPPLPEDSETGVVSEKPNVEKKKNQAKTKENKINEIPSSNENSVRNRRRSRREIMDELRSGVGEEEKCEITPPIRQKYRKSNQHEVNHQQASSSSTNPVKLSNQRLRSCPRPRCSYTPSDTTTTGSEASSAARKSPERESNDRPIETEAAGHSTNSQALPKGSQNDSDLQSSDRTPASERKNSKTRPRKPRRSSNVQRNGTSPAIKQTDPQAPPSQESSRCESDSGPANPAQASNKVTPQARPDRRRSQPDSNNRPNGTTSASNKFNSKTQTSQKRSHHECDDKQKLGTQKSQEAQEKTQQEGNDIEGSSDNQAESPVKRLKRNSQHAPNFTSNETNSAESSAGSAAQSCPERESDVRPNDSGIVSDSSVTIAVPRGSRRDSDHLPNGKTPASNHIHLKAQPRQGKPRLNSDNQPCNSTPVSNHINPQAQPSQESSRPVVSAHTPNAVISQTRPIQRRSQHDCNNLPDDTPSTSHQANPDAQINQNASRHDSDNRHDESAPVSSPATQKLPGAQKKPTSDPDGQPPTSNKPGRSSTRMTKSKFFAAEFHGHTISREDLKKEDTHNVKMCLIVIMAKYPVCWKLEPIDSKKRTCPRVNKWVEAALDLYQETDFLFSVVDLFWFWKQLWAKYEQKRSLDTGGSITWPYYPLMKQYEKKVNRALDVFSRDVSEEPEEELVEQDVAPVNDLPDENYESDATITIDDPEQSGQEVLEEDVEGEEEIDEEYYRGFNFGATTPVDKSDKIIVSKTSPPSKPTTPPQELDMPHYTQLLNVLHPGYPMHNTMEQQYGTPLAPPPQQYCGYAGRSDQPSQYLSSPPNQQYWNSSIAAPQYQPVGNFVVAGPAQPNQFVSTPQPLQSRGFVATGPSQSNQLLTTGPAHFVAAGPSKPSQLVATSRSPQLPQAASSAPGPSAQAQPSSSTITASRKQELQSFSQEYAQSAHLRAAPINLEQVTLGNPDLDLVWGEFVDGISRTQSSYGLFLKTKAEISQKFSEVFRDLEKS